MAWRLADSLDQLRDELNARWPGRDKSSDGAIGDQRHAAQGSASDHNPWVIDDVGRGVVRAYDIDVDLDGTNDGNGGQALEDLREHLRQLGESGDPRLQDHGYVISNGQIASATSNWAWRPHTTDPHFDHIHVSVARNQAGYDDTSAWLTAVEVTPAPAPESPQPPSEEDEEMALIIVEPDAEGGGMYLIDTTSGLVSQFSAGVDMDHFKGIGAKGPIGMTQAGWDVLKAHLAEIRG